MALSLSTPPPTLPGARVVRKGNAFSMVRDDDATATPAPAVPPAAAPQPSAVASDQPASTPVTTPGGPIPTAPPSTAPAPSQAEAAVRAATEAQKPLTDARVQNIQAQTNLVNAQAQKLNRRARRVRTAIGATYSGAIPDGRNTSGSGMNAPIATGGNTDLAAATRGTPEIQARAANDFAATASANASRLAAVRATILGNKPQPGPMLTATDVPDASRNGQDGSARIVRGQYGGGFAFTPNTTPPAPALAGIPRRRRQAAVTPTTPMYAAAK